MKSRILIFLFLVFVVASCGAEGFPAIRDAYEEVTITPTPRDTPAPTPEPVLDDAGGIGRAFYRAWELGDLLGMYSLLATQSQTLVASQDFVQRYEAAMTAAHVQAVRAQPLSLIQDGDQAKLGVRVTWETAVFGDIIREFNTPLAYQDGRWGIVWDEGLILPELAGGNRLQGTVRTPARANIYDKTGRALAFQGTSLRLGVIPGRIEDEAGLLNALSLVLGKTPAEIKEIYAVAQPDWYWPVGEISETVMQENAAALQPYIGKGLAPPEPRLARLYAPQGAAPHIVGYVGPIPAEAADKYAELGYQGDESVGLAGLEAWGEDILNGERGGILNVVGANGDYITTLAQVAPQQARSIFTTLDYEFQAAAEQALAEAIETYPGASAGSAVIMDVNTGDIKAIVSYPSYDPAIFDALSDEALAQLAQVMNDPQRPLLNRATQGAYPTGSLFKIITLSAALESGLYTADTRYTSTGAWYGLGENFVKYDWLQGGHGTISMRQALVVSCNSCFYEAGLNMDNVDNTFLPDTARDFGLGQLTGIEVSESAGNIPDPEWKLNTIGEGWATGDAVNMAIGQGFVQVTPLQMVNAVAAIANGGALYQPTVVDRIGAGAGHLEEELPSQVRWQLPISPATLATLREAMFGVTNSPSGTATHQFLELPLAVAGKTGTAEDPPRNSHAWFAGYAPAAPYTRPDGTVIENPEIALVVMIENAGEGSAVAAPIFRRLVELYYDIQPQRPLPWSGG
ncbi:MAG: penicillin-binding transpeptidase domain-containing protein [Chloroflexota bacterium]